jgi:hypothetical protein
VRRGGSSATKAEQLKQKRSGVGLLAYDLEQACPGYTLFTPSAGGNTIYLIDMEGHVAHTWAVPYPPGLYGHLTPSGALIYNGKTTEPSACLTATR